MSAQLLPRSVMMNSRPGLARAGQRLVLHTQRTRATLNRSAWSLLVTQADAQVEGDWAADMSGWYGSVELRMMLPESCLGDADEICAAAQCDPHLRVLLVRAARERASLQAGKLLRNMSSELSIAHIGSSLVVVAELSSKSTKHSIPPTGIAAGGHAL